ncbi:MAG TPA: hypothetical protein VLN46_01720 [Gillisia sp.]|nr:hypothetical protein [Gillisia sp.]
MNPTFIFHQTIVDGAPCLIENINIWDYSWQSTGKNAEVIDPLYTKPYNFSIYRIQEGDTKIEFAAGEFSNMIWGIYLPATKQ